MHFLPLLFPCIIDVWMIERTEIQNGNQGCHICRRGTNTQTQQGRKEERNEGRKEGRNIINSTSI